MVHLSPEATIALVALVVGLIPALLALWNWWHTLQHRQANRQLQYLPRYSNPSSNEIHLTSLREPDASMTIGIFILVKIYYRRSWDAWTERSLR
ncbi:hypothetical protein F4820DRAFT_436895 [Hypoxylon rubiginosum]|uniref:Uncharacterized protein n=1 Tax=Hypoxylon rubiginosum TaxID=110542 RepID=A0ACB9YMN1_9PEZI|nr:hypothetical protein F4820DRAFT_436895 [Hypoxylon rubiginosum]